MKKPEPEKVSTALEIFTIRQAAELIEVPVSKNKTEKRWRYETFYFTTADEPVTYKGIQYIPLSKFDQVKWKLL